MKSAIKILCILIFSIGFSGCKKEYQKEDPIEELGVPTLTTGWHKAIIKIGLKNNNLDGYGICYAEENVTSYPTISNDTVHLNMEGRATLSNLKDDIAYYWRTFIQAGDTILYSDVQKFTTLKLPEILTSVTDITFNSAILCGKFTNGYNATYIKRIFYYAQGSADTIDALATGNENFTVNAADLEDNTIYYAYAVVENSIGEKATGNTVSFTTLPYYPHCPEVETLDATDITANSAKLWGQITNIGDGYTEKGIIIGNSQDLNTGQEYPVTEPCDENGYFYYNLTGSGVFYYRAYIKLTGCETHYGERKSFETLPE